MRTRFVSAIALALLGITLVATSTAMAAATGPLPKLPSFNVNVKVKSGAQLAPGFTFIDQHQVVQEGIGGPMIVDNRGRIVWFHPLPKGVSAANFQVQSYEGKPVLTWWQGKNGNPAFGAFAPGIGQGEDVIMDSHYKIIKVIKTTDGIEPDAHEFYLTPQGTALISGYNPVSGVDMTSVGGSPDGTVIDSVIREIDVKTGKVLLDWSALAHVPLADSHALPLLGTSPWDFFHVNSISLAPNGNLLISSRHMWALYEVNRKTGAIVSTIGGKESDYSFGPGAAFAWQHDSRFVTPDEISLFDNQAGVPFGHAEPQSRALWLHIDRATHTATVARQIVQPSDQIETASAGSVQTLPNGHALVGWGEAATFAEYNRAGRMLTEGSLPDPNAGTAVLPNGQTTPNTWQTYRVFKEDWQGAPTGRPVLAVESKGANRWSVSASWNGATGVDRWEVLAGSERGDLRKAKVKSWNGLITTFGLKAPETRYLQIVAVDQSGQTLASSKVLAVHPG